MRTGPVSIFSAFGIASPSGTSARLYSRLFIAWPLCPPSSPTAHPATSWSLEWDHVFPPSDPLPAEAGVISTTSQIGTFKAPQILSATSSITAFDAPFFENSALVRAPGEVPAKRGTRLPPSPTNLNYSNRQIITFPVGNPTDISSPVY